MTLFWGFLGLGAFIGIPILCIGIAAGISDHGFKVIEIHRYYNGKDEER